MSLIVRALVVSARWEARSRCLSLERVCARGLGISGDAGNTGAGAPALAQHQRADIVANVSKLGFSGDRAPPVLPSGILSSR